jgi:hypothetical protein
LHLPGVTGSECQRAGTASVIPLVIGSIPIRQTRCRGHCRARAFPRQSSPDAVCCEAVRSGARLIRDTTRHQTSRGGQDSRVLFIGACPPYRAVMEILTQRVHIDDECRGAVAPALQAAPPLLASHDSQIVPRQRVSPAPMAWDILAPDFAAINIGEVDNRCTVSTNHAPATIISYLIESATIDHREGLWPRDSVIVVQIRAECRLPESRLRRARELIFKVT